MKGLKFDLKTSLSPDKGTKTANLSAFYKQSGLHSHATLDVFKVLRISFIKMCFHFLRLIHLFLLFYYLTGSHVHC